MPFVSIESDFNSSLGGTFDSIPSDELDGLLTETEYPSSSCNVLFKSYDDGTTSD
ncbi:hypothetical protein KM1_036300 [Entamoeba histolytica HM-3:IMSS]|uniref:Uncharacterized protein n=1 Tax=Entamoeba histolytica HM-3:IMSS TaxID=885315 RepID=M7WEH9_ENTHI|nr:hypothetical protein KM1_036300 [Entamoeba histolytica HM-3:IMSS]